MALDLEPVEEKKLDLEPVEQVARPVFLPLSAAQADAADAKAAEPIAAAVNEWSDKPLLELPRFEQQQDQLNEVSGGLINAGAGLVEGLSTPKNLALLPVTAVKSLSRIVAGLFGAQMAGGIPAQVEHLGEATESGTLQDKTEAWGGLVSSLFLTGAVTKHAAGKSPIKGIAEKLYPEQAKVDAVLPEKPIAEPVRPVEEVLPAEAAPVAAETLKPDAEVLPTEQLKPAEGIKEPVAIAEGEAPKITPMEPPPLSEGLYKAKNEEGRAYKLAQGFKWNGKDWFHPDFPGKSTFSSDVPVPSAERVRSELAKLRGEQGVGIPGDAQRIAERPASVSHAVGDYVTFEEPVVAYKNGKPFGTTKKIRGQIKIIKPDGTFEIKNSDGGYSIKSLDEITGKPNETTPPIQAGETPLKTEGMEAAAPEEVLSPGPGAASAAEPLASYEARRFGKRFQETESIDPQIREETGNRYYEPVSNKTTFQDALSIIEDRGTDESIRLVRDEDFKMEPRVRVTMGQALVKKLNQSHIEAKTAGDLPRAQEFLSQAVDTVEYISEVGTTLGQGVQAYAIWNKLSPEGFLLEATRIAKKSGTDLTPEQTARIAELSAAIEKAPEGFQRNEKTMDLMNFMSELKGIDPAEVPTALWYSNILSGFSTQMVNFLDTGLNVLTESAAMAASHPTAIPDIVTGLYQGMMKGGFEAANVLKTGRSATGDKVFQQRILERTKFGKEGGVPISTDTAVGRFMRTAFESKVATPLNLWKYPLRLMVASDTMFFNSFKEARARVLARALAKKEGLKGDELFQRVDEVLNQGAGKYDAALKQAQSENLEGLNLRRRTQEIIEQGRSDELVGAADEAAQIATYNHEPSGVLGLVANNIANITEGFKPAKAIVPFTRIVANVTNRGLNFTPWGYKRLFFGEWGGKKFGTEPPTGEAYRTQLVKATLGTTAMTAIAVLDANETVQVTAQGPENPEERKQLQNSGWKPYSVKVGDTYVSYQYTPVNLGFAMIGHYRDAIRYNKLSEKDAQTRLAYGMLKSSSTIFDMSFLSGVSDFIETVQGATSSTKGAGKLFARTATSVAIPNLVKQTDKLFDPTIYQADTITQALIRETPIARATMKPMLNALGEPIKPSQNRFFAFETDDPVWKLIVEKQAWVPVPSKTTKIKNRPITSDEYYRLIEESGPQVRSYIERNLGRFKKMDGEAVQNSIREEAERVRTAIKSRF